MNRFDKNFNGSDPETARPFSGGHPDGAWMISIIYGYILFFSLVGFLFGIYKSITGESIEGNMIVGAIISWILFAPPIRFIFMRSAKALVWCLGLLGVFIFALIGTLLSSPDNLLVIAAVVLAQAYICFYLYTLMKDKLLFMDMKNKSHNTTIDASPSNTTF